MRLRPLPAGADSRPGRVPPAGGERPEYGSGPNRPDHPWQISGRGHPQPQQLVVRSVGQLDGVVQATLTTFLLI